MRGAVLLVALLAGALAASCAGLPDPASATKVVKGSAPVVSLEAAQIAGLSARDLRDAGKLYTAKCMRCHKSYDPATYSQAQWDSWMGKMAKKAHLASEQEALLRRYLGAYRVTSPVAQPR